MLSGTGSEFGFENEIGTEAEKENEIFSGLISVRAVLAGADSGVSGRRIERIVFADEWLSFHGREGEEKRKLLGYLKAMSAKLGFSLDHAPKQMIEEMTGDASCGGIAAFCEKRTLGSLASDRDKLTGGFYLLLQGVEDPYNLGHAIRSAYAAGADGILLPEKNCMTSAGIVCRASAGASERIPLFTFREGDCAVFKAAGYRIVCADGGKDAQNAVLSDLSLPLLLVIGGEKRGISRDVMAAADLTVKIVYGRDFPLALSADSASAVLCFEVLRQKNSRL